MQHGSWTHGTARGGRQSHGTKSERVVTSEEHS
jgi:hypothetical protein